MPGPEDIISPCVLIPRIATQSRVYRDGKGLVMKYCRGGRPEGIAWEAGMLKSLAESRYFPGVYDVGPNYIIMEDLGESEYVTDLEIALRHACVILDDLRKAGISHNDLGSGLNILVKDNVPRIVDFGRATRGGPQPGSYPDHFLFITLVESYLHGKKTKAECRIQNPQPKKEVPNMAHNWAHSLVDTQPGVLLHEDVDLIQKLVGKLPKGRSVRVVELGATNGVVTLSALCARSTDMTVITIDPDERNLRWPGRVATNIDRRQDWQSIVADLDEAAGKLKAKSIDLLLLNTHSSYSQTKRILKDFLPKIRKGGFVWLHDYDDRTRPGEPVNLVRAPGVKRAVEEAVEIGLLKFEETGGLGWAGRK